MTKRSAEGVRIPKRPQRAGVIILMHQLQALQNSMEYVVEVDDATCRSGHLA